MKKWIGLGAFSIAALLIGCGGEGTGLGGTTATTGGVTSGSTTGDQVARFAGTYYGSFQGTPGSGDGLAIIDPEGQAIFRWLVGGSEREFDGNVNGAGNFVGTTQNESATGQLTLQGDYLRATLSWGDQSGNWTLFRQ
jgi:hypothetical protein